MVATAVASTFAIQASSPKPTVVAASMVTLTIVVMTDTPMQRARRVISVVEGVVASRASPRPCPHDVGRT